MTNTHLGGTLDIVRSCEDYLSARQGSYEFRCIRYSGVVDKLYDMNLTLHDSVTDVGAGRMQFGQYLTQECGWRGEYLPVDGSIDGANLETWVPGERSAFMVAIEVLEHLHNWERLMEIMESFSVWGCVATVPNPEEVDVLGCDPTHVSIITPNDFLSRGWSVERVSFFSKPNDTLLAWKRN